MADNETLMAILKEFKDLHDRVVVLEAENKRLKHNVCALWWYQGDEERRFPLELKQYTVKELK